MSFLSLFQLDIFFVELFPSDKIVVDIGMVGLIYFFTLCALFTVTMIWLMELFWNKCSNDTKVGGQMAQNVNKIRTLY